MCFATIAFKEVFIIIGHNKGSLCMQERNKYKKFTKIETVSCGPWASVGESNLQFLNNM